MEPDWPDAIDAQFWFLITQGDHAFYHATLDEAFGHLKAAEAVAQRLLKAEPDVPRSQRDLSVSYDRIGNVQRAQGDLPSALRGRDTATPASNALKHHMKLEFPQHLKVSQSWEPDNLRTFVL